MFSRVVLVISAVSFALFGIGFMAFPGYLVMLVTSSALPSAVAATDVRAIYGGMALGLGSVLFHCVHGDRGVLRIGLTGAALTFGLIALARLLGMLLGGSNPMMYLLLASEVLGVASCAAALRTVRP